MLEMNFNSGRCKSLDSGIGRNDGPMAPACCRKSRATAWFHDKFFRLAAALILLSFLVFSWYSVPSIAAAQERAPDRANQKRNSKESTILPTDVPIQLSAERLSVNRQTNTLTARGNVTVSQGNMRIRADTVQYEGDTGLLTARGRVIVRTGSDVVEAERFSINLPSATGVMYNGKLLLTRHNVYLEGKKLEKTGESTYHIEEGSFTTCNAATPDWRITGKDLDVTLEGYGRLKHGFFYVRDIPVFYLPWFIYPAKRKRQTGFLMPAMSSSTSKGFDVRLPFFLDISPSVDATIVPRVCTKRAAQTSLELRYIPTEDFRGRFYGEWTYDWQYGPEADPRSHRFYCTFQHDQTIARLLQLKGNGTWISDRDYFELWGGRVDRRLRVRYLESNAILCTQSNNALFQAETRYFDNLDVPDNAVTVQNLPIVTGTLFNQQIPYTPFYFSSNAVYNYFYAPAVHKKWLGSRLQANARLGLPIALGRYLKLEPSIAYLAKGYDAEYFENRKSVKAVTTLRTDLYEVNGDLFTDLQAVFDTPFLGFQRMQHSIRPRFTWTYRPPTRQDTYPYFDDTDRIDRTNLLTAELRQTLTGRLGPGEYLDFFTFNVAQGYDFDRVSANGDWPSDASDLIYGLTNTRAQLTLRPHTLIDLSAQAEYDPVMNRARKYTVGLGLMDHRGDMVRVLHQFIEGEMKQDLNRQTNVSVQLKLTSNLECFFENQFTHQFNFSYFTSVGLAYHPQCWSIELKYSEAREQDPLTQRIKEPDQTVFMTVSLYGLGQVYRMTRDWADLFGLPTGGSEPLTR
jgi:LPS-assembly protein